MPSTDMTYCTGDLCPLQEECRRCITNHADLPDPLWMMAPVYNDDIQYCEHYIPDEE